MCSRSSAAGSLLLRRAPIRVAVLSALLYAGLVLAQYQGHFQGVELWIVAPAGLPPVRVALYLVGIDVGAFLAVGVLAGFPAERLRSAGARLESASTEIASLQAFNQDIIDSLTSGLLTTDVTGRILLFNRAAETITGHAAGAVVGRDVGEVLLLPDEVRGSSPATPTAPRAGASTSRIPRGPDGRSRSAWRSHTC